MSTSSKTYVQRVSQDVIREIIEGSLSLDEDKLLDQMDSLHRLMKFIANPTVVGAENIPEPPVLYIGNHSTMAFDVAVAAPCLAQASGRVVRGMSDEIMYRSPRIRQFVISMGAVMGHPQIGDALFEAGKDILLFPGGAYEANKNLDQRYTLQWKQRTGFVRMAAKRGVPIVPVGIVGPDEWFGRYMDRDEVANSWLGTLMRRAGASEEFMQSDQCPPIPRGIFGSLLPRPQRAYICIGKPISTKRFEGRSISKKSQERVRDITRERLEDCIARMLLLQSQDRDRVGVLRRFLSFY